MFLVYDIGSAVTQAVKAFFILFFHFLFLPGRVCTYQIPGALKFVLFPVTVRGGQVNKALPLEGCLWAGITWSDTALWTLFLEMPDPFRHVSSQEAAESLRGIMVVSKFRDPRDSNRISVFHSSFILLTFPIIFFGGSQK